MSTFTFSLNTFLRIVFLVMITTFGLTNCRGCAEQERFRGSISTS